MTKERHTLTVTNRTVLGKKSKNLRKEKLVPGNIFGAGMESHAVEVSEKTFSKLFLAAGETSLVYLSIDGENKEYPVLISDVQIHPTTGKMLHVSFHKVNLKEKVEADIKVETVGESEAVKAGGVLVVSYNEIPVKALPTDLPENFTIDISPLKAIGDSLHMKDLVFDRSKIDVELDEDEVLVSVQAQEEEVVEVSTEPVEVETTVQGKKEEAVEGEEKPEAKKEE